MSNALFEPANQESVHNAKMDLIKRIDAILDARAWGWADLARAMGLSEQRVNNWRSRGVPAAQVRNIEAALGLKRYALDEESAAEDEAASVIAEFAYVYRHVSVEGRHFLRDMIASVKRAYMPEVRGNHLTAVRGGRKKA